MQPQHPSIRQQPASSSVQGASLGVGPVFSSVAANSLAPINRLALGMQATGAFLPTAVRAAQPKRVPAPKPSPFVLLSPPKKRGLQWHRLALLLGVALALLVGLAWGALLLWQGAQQGLQ